MFTGLKSKFKFFFFFYIIFVDNIFLLCRHNKNKNTITLLLSFTLESNIYTRMYGRTLSLFKSLNGATVALQRCVTCDYIINRARIVICLKYYVSLR